MSEQSRPAPETKSDTIFNPGSNCLKVASAERVSEVCVIEPFLPLERLSL
jgi:hypothetical protein